MFNQKGFIKIALIIVALILIGGVYFVYNNTKNDSITKSFKSFVRIVSPNGGENLEVGKNYKIKWEGVGFGIDDKVYVYISYKYDDMIASQVFAFPKNTGSLDWKPSVKSGSYKIKIKVHSKKEKKDFSDSSDEFFNISIPSSAEKLKGDSNLDGIINCEDIYHVFDVSFVSEIYNLDNSDYNKDKEVDLEDARLLMSDLAVRGIKCFSIDSISPLFGNVGTEVTLKGVGFDLPSPGEWGGEILNFGKGVLEGLDWDTEENKVSFKVPSEICTHDTEAIGGCLEGKSLSITPDIYEIYLDSAFGQSNKVKFTVMPNEKISDRNETKNNKITPKDYSLVNYPLKESPIYDQRADYCYKPESQEEIIQKDTRLVKNSGEIVIPSIRQLIFASENKKQSCRAWINFFSIPQNGNYLYLEVQESNKGGAEFFLYKLDLFNFSIKKMSFPVEIGIFDMNYDYYKILSDGKRLVKWSIDKVYLINLETNSYSVLYTAPQNHWLIASMSDDEVFTELKYDVKIDDRQIIIGVYHRDRTKNNALLELHNSGEEIELMFVKQVTIPIPAN